MKLETLYTAYNKEVLPRAILKNEAPFSLDGTEYTGELFFTGTNQELEAKVIAVIDSASEVICLQSYILQTGPVIDALKKAAERGVRVFITSAAGRAAEFTDKFSEHAFVKFDHEKLLSAAVSENIIYRSGGKLHAKFIVSDPESKPRGFLFTGNCVRDAFLKNKEAAVALGKTAVMDLFNLFVYYFWEECSCEFRHREFVDIKPAQKFKKPELRDVFYTENNDTKAGLGSILSEAVLKAEKSIKVSAYWIDSNNILYDSLLHALKTQKQVTIFTRFEETQKQPLIRLSEAGAKVFVSYDVHAKMLYVDDKDAYLYTANIDAAGMATGFDTGLKLSTAQAEDMVKMLGIWEREFQGRFCINAALKDMPEVIETYNGGIKTRKYGKFSKQIGPKSVKKAWELIEELEKKYQCETGYGVTDFTISCEVTDATAEEKALIKTDMAAEPAGFGRESEFILLKTAEGTEKILQDLKRQYNLQLPVKAI